MAKIICEGLDRLGKSTLISGILNRLGYHEVIHFDKPKSLEVYSSSLFKYQEASFKNLFRILSCSADVICDRSHIGEYVYAPLYRSYDGGYVYDLEDSYIASGSNFHLTNRLILLTCEDPSVFGEDDGQSFDWSMRRDEQDAFIRAVERSRIRDKKIIRVDRNGEFRPAREILDEALA